MKTTFKFSDTQLRWRLENNVLPRLNENAVNGIIQTYNDFHNGKIGLEDTLNKNTDCTVGEMFEDLRIDY